ncbi:LRR receptor-like serine/threonine-protein kinase [Carex littledalei]|uniref:LRR receptor-like serine/threonine-protein kinase n=1 Tax=Carex littledalei TaxID=544730 RepID=A0A833Q8A3_9POAL|nr:LRR receptor-like serine/threonine-protein kinase [Carex littledalei]
MLAIAATKKEDLLIPVLPGVKYVVTAQTYHNIWGCSSVGVTCDSNYRVTGLSLVDNKIIGGIPEQLGNLSSLSVLNLRNNLLTGAIPVSLGRLLELQIL